MTETPDKTSLRNLYKLVRSHIGTEYAAKASSNVASRFIKNIELVPEMVVAGSMPIKGEISVLPLLEQLLAQNIICAMPVITAHDAPLSFGLWKPDTEMVTEISYGIPEPSAPVFVTPDIIIIPLVACTKKGARLGYGKGFYDRTLSALRLEKKILAIGICFECQIADTLPEEPWDERLDLVITEKAVIDCKNPKMKKAP